MSLYKLFKADNPDEYAEIIVPRNREAISGIKSRRFFESRGKENFGISTSRGTLRNHPAMAGWGSIKNGLVDNPYLNSKGIYDLTKVKSGIGIIPCLKILSP